MILSGTMPAIIAADSDFHMTRLLERVDLAMYEAKSRQQKEIFWESNIVKSIFPGLNRRKSKSRRKLLIGSD